MSGGEGEGIERRAGFDFGRTVARPVAQYRALRDADCAGRLLLDRRADLRDDRQSREHPAAGVGDGDHRRRPHFRDPHRRDRSQRRRDRQRHRDRADLLHDAARLRQHRQPAAAGPARDHPGDRRLFRARPGHRFRRHQDRHPVVHHDAGDDADRGGHIGGAGARADRLFRAAADPDAWLEVVFRRAVDHHRRGAAVCSSRISC